MVLRVRSFPHPTHPRTLTMVSRRLERPDMLIYKPEGSHASTLVVSDLAITKDVEWSKTLSSNQGQSFWFKSRPI